MKNESSNYRHSLPALDLSIERNTNLVPPDGKFYIVHKGTVIANFPTKKKADERFYEMVKESGYKPEPIAEKVIKEGSNERYLRSKDLFWAEGPKYKSKGGHGR